MAEPTALSERLRSGNVGVVLLSISEVRIQAMFYCASALLAGEGLSFSSHSAVIAAFGRQCARTGRILRDLHRALVQAQEVRLGADYLVGRSVPGEEAVEQIRRAKRSLAVTEELLGGPSPEDE